MEDLLETVLGAGRDVRNVDPVQMALRTVVVYAFTLAVVRFGSRRFLGKATAFDLLVSIVIGSVMSRAINGSAPFLPTLVSGAVLVAMHGLLARIAYHVDWFGPLVKGEPILLIEDGRVRPEGLRRAHLSQKDLDEAIRLKGYDPAGSSIRLAYLERNGEISVIRR